MKKALIYIQPLVIAVSAAAVYLFTLDYPFLFDDIKRIVENPAIGLFNRAPALFYDLGGEMPSRPLTMFTLMINHALGGLEPAGYRLFNIILHMANSLLLWGLVRRVALYLHAEGFSLNRTALFTALLFALHPVQTESVTYIISRSMLLSTFFYLSGFWVFLLAAEALSRQKNILPHTLLMLVICLLGVSSRENFVTFAVMLVIFDYVVLSGGRAWKFGDKRGLYACAVIPLIYLFWLVSGNDYKGTAGLGIEGFGPYEYMLTQLHVLWTYIGLLIAPVGQNLDYDYPLYRKLWSPGSLIALSGWLMVWASGAWCALNRSRFIKAAGFCIIWFMMTLMPSSSVMPLKDLIFEHRLYLPSAGFFCLVSMLLTEAASRYRVLAKPLVIGGALLCVALSVLTVQRNLLWKRGASIWKDTVMKSPLKARPHVSLAVYLKREGLFVEAENELLLALQAEPENQEALFALANLHAADGRFDEAAKLYSKLLQINPSHYKAWFNLGNTLRKAGKLKRALNAYQQALRAEPGYAPARHNLTGLLIELDSLKP